MYVSLVEVWKITLNIKDLIESSLSFDLFM